MIKRILVGLGGTPYTPVAIKRAVGLAKRFEAEITGVTVIDVSRLSMLGAVGGERTAREIADRISLTKERIDEAIGKFEAACTAEGIKYRVKQEDGEDPFDLMISLARYHDLMIFGLRSIFEYGISPEEPKDTLARLISAGVRPLIAVSDKFRPIQKALIAYSGSMESAKTMKRFIQLCPWPNVRLKIITFEHPEEETRQLLYDAAEYCRDHGFTVDTDSNPGSPKDYLFAVADLWQADLIVIGNSARSLLMRRILGDTALHIIRNADRPLFLCQ